jgi:thioredoxin reductase
VEGVKLGPTNVQQQEEEEEEEEEVDGLTIRMGDKASWQSFSILRCGF